MKTSDQNGFSAVEALLVLVIVGILGFTGWFVWQAKQNSNESLSAANDSKQVAAKRAGLSLSKERTYYDCLDAVLPETSTNLGSRLDKATRDCRYADGSDEKTYTAPTSYSDDMIRGTKGFKFTAQERTELRSIARKWFKDCEAGYAEVLFYGEAKGVYLNIGTQCGDDILAAHSQELYLQDDSWKVISNDKGGLSCDTITQLQIPASILRQGGYSTCHTSTSGKDINTLKGYKGYKL